MVRGRIHHQASFDIHPVGKDHGGSVLFADQVEVLLCVAPVHKIAHLHAVGRLGVRNIGVQIRESLVNVGFRTVGFLPHIAYVKLYPETIDVADGLVLLRQRVTSTVSSFLSTYWGLSTSVSDVLPLFTGSARVRWAPHTLSAAILQKGLPIPGD